ncbi:hypothetical protein E0K83_04170 [Gramella sp. BOM4]|nr:hypothetical protein [Christiangramia bathymodioli]
MKIFKFLAVFTVSVLMFTGCTDDDITNYAFAEISAPTNVGADFDITQDDTGTVTITPSGEGAQMFEIYFGDSENETPTEIAAGESVTHVYDEGEYQVKIVAIGSTGLTSEFNQMLTVSFKAPENMVIAIDQPDSNPKQITVTPSADYATLFEVYFGDVDDEEPVVLMPGESATHTYEPGVYEITVIAKGAGTATTEEDAIVIIPEASDPLKLPMTFDMGTVNYSAGTFGGTSYEVVTNPDASGANPSESNVAAITNSGANWEGIAYNLGEPVDFGGSRKIITMKFWSDVAVPVLLKFEGGVNGERQTEVVANHGGTGWEELTFNFATDAIKSFVDGDPENGQPFVPTGQYSTMVIFVDGPGNTAGTFYVDDIVQSSAAFESTMVQDFEGTAPAFTVFGNIAATEVVDNPDQSGVNTTSKVAKLTKTSGSEVWAGTFFEVASPLDLNSYNTIRVKTWSPKEGIIVKLKLENQDASITHEVDLTTSVANQWENLDYNFSGAPAADYVRVVIFFDFGNPGDDSEYYYDEIQLTNGGVEQPADMVFQDFEGDVPAFTVFGNIDPIEVVANPDQSGENTSAMVAKMLKTSGSEVWAGAFFETAEPLDLDTYSKIRVKTWSPKEGIVVKLKLENQDASITHEVDLTTSVADQWENLVYDFSDAPEADYVRVVIFFDFDTAGDDSVYYYDEFALTN